jgi:hypothetical protein
MNITQQALRLLCLGTLALFLGGIAVCTVLNAGGHLWTLIVPGLCMLVLCGAALALNGRSGIVRRIWLGAEQVLAIEGPVCTGSRRGGSRIRGMFKILSAKGLPLAMVLEATVGCVELTPSVVNPSDYLTAAPSPASVYAASSATGVVLPIGMRFPSMDALMLFAFEDDPRYRDVELQIMSHDDERLPRVILYRLDGGCEVHVRPNPPTWLQEMQRTDGVLNRPRFMEADIAYNFDLQTEGLHASLQLHRADGLTLSFVVKEHGHERLRASILAPVGADTQTPTFFPFFYLKSLALVPRADSDVDLQIDGQHRPPATLTRWVKGPASYLIRYSTNPLLGRWHETTSFAVVPRPVQAGTTSWRDGQTELELAWNAGRAEIASQTWHRENADVRFRFGPAWPDVLALRDGAVVSGRFSVDVSDDAGVLAGEYRVQRQGNKIFVQLHPTLANQPPTIKGGPWVAHYVYDAVMEPSLEGHVSVRAAWSRRRAL